MALQQSDLDTLDAAIASGILEVRYADGRSVRYQALDQLIAARGVVASQLATAAAALRGARRQRFATYRSGF